MPRVNPHFSGRVQELAQLHDSLNRGGTVAMTQAVAGLGGIGKTALAVQYAHTYAAEYDYQFFCLADSLSSLNAGYRAIASELALPIADNAPPEEVRDAVKSWLETTPRYLLILDNADFGEKLSQEQLAEFLPAPPVGQVLITTRTQNLQPGLLSMTPDSILRLGVMNPDEAVTFLIERTQGRSATLTDDEATAATELAKELGYLALALEQAGAYIAQPGRTFRNYVSLFRKELVKQLEKSKPETGRYKDSETEEWKTVATTWQISLYEIEKEKHVAAIALLNLSAYLAPDDIPAEIVYAAATGTIPAIKKFFAGVRDNDEEKQARFIDLLEPLMRYSLVVVEGDPTCYSIHRLVQAVVQHRQSESKRLKGKQAAIKTVNKAFPDPEFVNWKQCQRLLSCAMVVSEYTRIPKYRNTEASVLLSIIAYYLEDQNRLSEAEPLYLEALRICRKVLPAKHPNIATSLNNLASLYESQNRLSEALPLYLESLEIRREILPAKHPDIALILNNLAGLYRAKNRLSEAELLYLEALEICREVLPAKHPSIATSLNNLAGLYRVQNRLSEALSLYLESLEIRREILPAKHPDIALSLSNLGGFYESQNRLSEALPLHLESLEIRREILPAKHPDIAQSLNNLANLYRSKNRLSEAELLYLEALEICRVSLVSDHPITKIVEGNLEYLREAIRRQGVE